VYSLLAEYSKNLSLSLPLPLVWKLPFDVHQDFGVYLVKYGKGLSFPFGRKLRSPLDPESNWILILLLGQLLRGCLLTLED
jgi:hypothetical protein